MMGKESKDFQRREGWVESIVKRGQLGNEKGRQKETEVNTEKVEGDPAAYGDMLARRWIDANLIGYRDNELMFEKYNAFRKGESGGGGEYEPQAGFGWTNGVVLDFLARLTSP